MTMSSDKLRDAYMGAHGLLPALCQLCQLAKGLASLTGSFHEFPPCVSHDNKLSPVERMYISELISWNL